MARACSGGDLPWWQAGCGLPSFRADRRGHFLGAPLPRLAVEWFDSTNGLRVAAEGLPFPVDAVHGLRTPGPNAAQDPDWAVPMRSMD
jgi:hypothetical protein